MVHGIGDRPPYFMMLPHQLNGLQTRHFKILVSGIGCFLGGERAPNLQMISLRSCHYRRFRL